jgi:hypothetical protein
MKNEISQLLGGWRAKIWNIRHITSHFVVEDEEEKVYYVKRYRA